PAHLHERDHGQDWRIDPDLAKHALSSAFCIRTGSPPPPLFHSVAVTRPRGCSLSKSAFSPIRTALVAISALALCAGHAAAQDVNRMDQVVRASADADEFSGAVLVARDGEILLDQGYGFADRE